MRVYWNRILFVVFLSLLLIGAIFGGTGAAEPAAEYEYPIENPLKATVLGAPGERDLDEVVFRERLLSVTPFPDRPLPARVEGLRDLPFLLARQPNPAPLIFCIAGTGSNHDAFAMRRLRTVFHRAGFHVVSLGSPFTRRFAIAASESAVPGIAEDDARDLYRVMKLVRDEIADRITVTETHLMGYSLGASNAAFLARLDAEEGTLGFRRVLLVNPPLNLLDSAERFDRFIADNVAGRADRFLDEMMEKVSAVFRSQGRAAVDDKFLYELERVSPLTDGELEGLVGIVFRLALSKVLFASDLMNGGGNLLPPGTVLRIVDSTTPFFRAALHWTFRDYAREVVLPRWRTRYPDADLDQLRREADLRRIADFLRNAPDVALFHNRDDIILGPGDIAAFREIFGDRARIQSRGGHLGNMLHGPNIERMIRFFKNEGGGA
jgi:predicted esterase